MQCFPLAAEKAQALDSRLRGNDGDQGRIFLIADAASDTSAGPL